MLSKEEIENSIEYKYNKFYESDTYQLTTEEAKYILLEDKCFRDTVNFAAAKTLLNKVEQLETNNKNLIEKLEEKRTSAEKCYQDLIKPYYDKKLNIINTSYMSKREKEEFINKRNCLLVQKHCYEEILKIAKGEKE